MDFSWGGAGSTSHLVTLVGEVTRPGLGPATGGPGSLALPTPTPGRGDGRCPCGAAATARSQALRRPPAAQGPGCTFTGGSLLGAAAFDPHSSAAWDLGSSMDTADEGASHGPSDLSTSVLVTAVLAPVRV